MNYDDRPDCGHLTRNDLDGVAASLRTVFTAVEDGKFDKMLRDLDRVWTNSCSHSADTQVAAGLGRWLGSGDGKGR